MRYLSKLTIEGFKSFEHLELELNPGVNVLIGANGSGKSSLVTFFRMMNALYLGGFQRWVGVSGGAEQLLRFGTTETKTLSFRLKFHPGSPPDLPCSLSVEVTPNRQGGLLLAREDAIMHDPETGDHPVSASGPGFLETGMSRGNQALLASSDPVFAQRIHMEVSAVLGSIATYHVADTSPLWKSNGVADNERLREYHHSSPDPANLAAVLYGMRHQSPDRYDTIRRATQVCVPAFDDFILVPEKLNDTRIQLMWRHKGRSEPFYGSQLSDGTLRFVFFATALLQRPEDAPIVVLDEPELGLHPVAIELLAGLIQGSAKERQVILATQSADLLNYFAPEDLLVVDHGGNQSTITRLDPTKLTAWLEDYSLGALWKKNVIGGRPRQWQPSKSS